MRSSSGIKRSPQGVGSAWGAKWGAQYKTLVTRMVGDIGATHGTHHDAFATLACAALLCLPVSDVDDVDSTCSRELDKVTAVAGDARTCAAQGTLHDAGVDDAVCRDGQQNAGSPGGFFAEALHVTTLYELA